VGADLLDDIMYNWGTCTAVLGNDGCMYWPSLNANRTLKFDPETQTISLVGDDFGGLQGGNGQAEL
jgi:hypothetical protein